MSLSDKELDRLSREAADRFNPDDDMLSWGRLEKSLSGQLPERPPGGTGGFGIRPFFWVPAAVLVAGVSLFLIKNHSTYRKISTLSTSSPSAGPVERRAIAPSRDSAGTSSGLATGTLPPERRTPEGPAASAPSSGEPEMSTTGAGSSSVRTTANKTAANTITPGTSQNAGTLRLSGKTKNLPEAGISRTAGRSANRVSPRTSAAADIAAAGINPVSGRIDAPSVRPGGQLGASGSRKTRNAKSNAGAVSTHNAESAGTSENDPTAAGNDRAAAKDPIVGSDGNVGNDGDVGNESNVENDGNIGNDGNNGNNGIAGNRPIAGNYRKADSDHAVSEGNAHKDGIAGNEGKADNDRAAGNDGITGRVHLPDPVRQGNVPGVFINDSLLAKLAAIPPGKPVQGRKLDLRQPLSFGVVFGPDYTSGGLAGDQFSNNLGVSIGYYITKNFSVNTGVVYTIKSYWARGQDFQPQPQRVMAYGAFPHIESVNGSVHLFEIPLTLRYDFPIAGKTRLFAGAGLSSYLVQRETLTYFFHNRGQEYAWKFEDNQPCSYWFGVAHFSAGIEQELGKGISFQAEPFVNTPFQNIGAGKVKLNTYGLMFSLRYTPVLGRNRR